MDPLERHYIDITRRRFFGRCATGAMGALGMMALSDLATAAPRPEPTGGVHFRPKAKRVIYMHMEGAPSQLDLWDYKPQLRKRFDEDLPDSIRGGQRLTRLWVGDEVDIAIHGHGEHAGRGGADGGERGVTDIGAGDVADT